MSDASLADALVALVPWLGVALILWVQRRWS